MSGILHFLDQKRLIAPNGQNLGASIHFYTTGTLTPATIYSDAALTTPLANPVVVAAGGLVPAIYLDPAVTYRRRIVWDAGYLTPDDVDPYNGLTATQISKAGGGTVQDALFPERRTSSFRVAFQDSGEGLFVGGNVAGFKGLVIGGGDATDGTEGTRVNLSGHSTWVDYRPTRNYASVEMALNPTMATSVGTITAGGNTFTITAGSPADNFWIGKKVYIDEGRYLVSGIASNVVTVTNLDGSPVSWGGTDTASILKFCIVYGSGTCNVSGTTVTRVSGDPFIVFTSSPSFVFRVNGVARAVLSGDPDTITLSASAGTLTNVPYEFWTDINDQISTIRLQNTGSEFVAGENLSIYSRYDGYWYEAQEGASGRPRALFFTSGRKSGSPRRQIVAYPDGRVTLGGPVGQPALSIDPVGTTEVNFFGMASANTGASPVFTARGSDTNVGMALDTKGTGAYRFTNNSFGNVAFDILANAGADWLQVAGSTGRAFITAAGGSANIDVQIDPKGTGRVRFGTFTSNADAPINGFVEIRDAAGNIRKLATIA